MALQGTGTQADPYLIGTLADLREFSESPTASSTYWTAGKYTKLTADIDASDTANWNGGSGFLPVGYAGAYRGVFFGSGKTILNVYINMPLSDRIGLFSYISNLSSINNLKLVNPVIIGRNRVGSLIGESQTNSILENCCTVGGSVSADTYGGSFLGIIGSDTTVVNCYSSTSFTASTSTFNGGFVGVNLGSCTLCFFNGTTNRAGFSGYLGGYYIGNYYDSTISGKTDNVLATPKTTTEMKTQSTYVGWDFENVWFMKEGQYPQLRAFIPLAITADPTAVYALAGDVVEMSAVVSGGNVTNLSLKLTDTSTGSILSTSSPYSYTVDPDDSGKNFQWEAFDGVDTVQSVLIPVDYPRLSINSPADIEVMQGVQFSINWLAGGGIRPYTAVYSGQGSGTETNSTGDFIYSKVSDYYDTGTYTITVTDRDETVTDSVCVRVLGRMPLAGYRVRLNLAIDIAMGFGQSMSTYDFGHQRDKYTANIDYITEGINPVFHTVANSAPYKINDYEGLFPCAPHMSGDVFGKRYPEYKGKINDLGTWHGWEVEVIPDMQGLYTYVSYAYTPCSITGFSFGTLVDFPVPEVQPIFDRTIVYNRIGTVIREYDKGKNNESKKVKMKWENLSNYACGVLLSYIAQQVRSIPVDVDFGSVKQMSPWWYLDTVGNVFSMRLSSPEIQITNKSGNLWDVEIEMIKGA